MPKSKNVDTTNEDGWKFPMESQVQLMQIQLALFQEEREHSKRNFEEKYQFLTELYGISKTSIGLLIPLLVSTYAYPVVPNIGTIRIFIASIIFLLIFIVIIYLRFLRIATNDGKELRESRAKLMRSMLDHCASVLAIRDAELKAGLEVLKRKSKSRP